MLVQLHGWHMSMPRPERRNVPIDSPYLILQVDMRGRAFSEGEQDCNGLELIDVYDAVKFVHREYAAYLRGADPVYLEGGSGGGGNVLAMIAKFPDLFAAATALCGISDYAAWYAQDRTGEFRDEMDVWIGCLPEQHKERYAARSGLQLAANVRTPLYMAHGDGDFRVPVSHSRLYSEEMWRLGKRKLIRYDELPGVGERRHFDHASEAQMQRIAMESERNRLDHLSHVVMPERGRLLVGGYVYTRQFQVRLETVNALASLDYDAETRHMRLMAADGNPSAAVYEIRCYR